RLSGATLRAGGDRIVAGTVISAVALCGGDVTVCGVDANDMQAVLQAFRSEYCKIDENELGIRVRADGRVRARSIITAPYPLFPTDMQPQYFACQCFSDGVSRICETVFDGRFAHAREFEKMGARISLHGNTAVIEGVESGLHCADLTASDLRGGAGLCVAAMKVDGESRIYKPHFIDRGYEDFEGMFSALGANIVRIKK
nr:UDP-N-acetylglucosamine 1-carboxyvinyltransferase [Clostridia bacterium]